jgi:hypothetical protein
VVLLAYFSFALDNLISSVLTLSALLVIRLEFFSLKSPEESTNYHTTTLPWDRPSAVIVVNYR